MATTAGDFITKLATMAGLDTSNPDLVSILSNSEFSNYKIPDEVAGRINSSLLTMDSARNNENLRRHYHAEILNGLDTNIESVMERFGVEQDIADAIRQEKKKWKKDRAEAIEKKKEAAKIAVTKRTAESKSSSITVRKVDKSMPLNKYVAH